MPISLSLVLNMETNEGTSNSKLHEIDTDSTKILANAGIVPSDTATYTSAQIQAAIQKAFGFQATIGCSSGALNEIWYSFEVQGSAASGTYVATGPGWSSHSSASLSSHSSLERL